MIEENLDVVVTVPKDRWQEWLEEGDLAGEPSTGREYVFTTRAITTDIGARLYIVAWGRLRGYAPVTGTAWAGGSKVAIYRAGDAVACTIDGEIEGFQGARRRWWDRRHEKPFPNWQTEGVG